MIIVSVKSSKVKWINDLNELTKVPIIGSLFLACIFMFPTFIIQFLIELILGDIPLYDLSFTFFFNTFWIHLFIRILFDVRINFFFISTLIFCLIGMTINYFNEKEMLIQMLGF